MWKEKSFSKDVLLIIIKDKEIEAGTTKVVPVFGSQTILTKGPFSIIVLSIRFGTGSVEHFLKVPIYGNFCRIYN